VIAKVFAGDADDLRGFWASYDDVDVQPGEAAVGLGVACHGGAHERTARQDAHQDGPVATGLMALACTAGVTW
jgi:hypothetical protein